MSSNENIDIEKLFSDRFDNYQPDFSESFKNKIKVEADKKAKSIRRARLYKWLIPGGITGILAVSLVVWNMYSAPTMDGVNLTLPAYENDKDFASSSTENETIDIPSEISETLDVWETPRVSIPAEEVDEYMLESNSKTEEESNNVQQSASEPEKKDDMNIKLSVDVKLDSSSFNRQTIKKATAGNKEKDIPMAGAGYAMFPNTKAGRARFEAHKLKSGALLVRLKTFSKTISELEKHGYTATARKKEEQVRNSNLALIKAFRKNYSFSKLYFFYATDSDSIRNGSTSGIFLDDQLNKDESIQMTASFFMIADIGQAELPSKAVKEGYHHNDDMLNRVIVFSNQDFVQMASPFPYYQKASWPSFDMRNIRKMNAKLYQFHGGH